MDESFRARVEHSIQDPAVAGFWRDEFGAYDRAFRTVAVAPVQNKVGKLVAHPPLRAVLGHARSRLSLARVLDSRQLVVCNLSGSGAAAANLLGSLYLSGLIEEAMSRPMGERAKPFYLVLDESHRFTTESLAVALSEARKFNVGLILAEQLIEQSSERLQLALMGNVGSLMSFRVGAADAEVLEKNLGREVTAGQLASLDPYEAIIRTLDGREQVGPLRLSLPPLEARYYGRASIMRQESLRRLSARQKRSEGF